MFRFTIRDLILFTMILALGIGWALDHCKLARNLYVAECYAGQWKLQLIFTGNKPYDGPPQPAAWGP